MIADAEKGTISCDRELIKTVIINVVDNALKASEEGKTVEVNDNTELESINLAGSSIETLDTDGCENLQELNVAGCANLKSLSCSKNSLVALDLEECPILEEAEVSGQTRTGVTLSTSMNFSDLLNSSVFSSGIYDSEFMAAFSAGKVRNLKASDSSGNEISTEYDNTTGTMKFASVPASFSYDYMTGYKDVSMDVKVSSTSSEGEENNEKLGASGGGCNGYFGSCALLALACLSFLKQKR